MRTFKQKLQTESRLHGVLGGTVLPTHRKLAIFARQSSNRQVEENIESREYQTQDLLEMALEWGWKRDDVDIIDDDLGVSGRSKRIDQRPGMSKLFAGIKNKRYGAVLTAKVDRLFRDRFGTQSGMFTEACYEHGILILTPKKAYNLDRYDERREFQDKLQEAANYSDEVIIDLLLERRKRASMHGRYDGRVVPVGFIVDRSDRKNKRFAVYEAHARVVRWLFKRFRELGSVSAVHREVARLPYVFPEFEAGTKPEKIHVDRKGVGYGLSRDGLISILTNPVYIGTWILRNKDKEVIANISNNHPAIVDEDDFYYAFRRLSPSDVDGTPFKQVKQRVHHEKEHDGPLASKTSLLRDVITSPDGPVYAATTKAPRNKQEVLSYAIIDIDEDTKVYAYKSYINMAWLDGLFAERLLYVVAQWASGEDAGQAMFDALKAEKEAKEHVLMDIEEQLAGYYRTIANIDRFIQVAGSVADVKTLQEYAVQLADARANVADLERQKREATVLDADREECDNLLDCACSNWVGMTLEKQRRFIRLIIREVSISVPAPHFIKLRIKWRRPYIVDEVGLIFKRGGSSPLWTDDESALIKRMYPRADRETILRSFPTRSWNSIKQQAQGLGVERTNLASRYPLHPALSIADAEFMQRTGYTSPHEKPVLWGTLYMEEILAASTNEDTHSSR